MVRQTVPCIIKIGERSVSVGSKFGNVWIDGYGLETKHRERMLTICGYRVRQGENGPSERLGRCRNPEANHRVSQNTNMIPYEVGEQDNKAFRGTKCLV